MNGPRDINEETFVCDVCDGREFDDVDALLEHDCAEGR